VKDLAVSQGQTRPAVQSAARPLENTLQHCTQQVTTQRRRCPWCSRARCSSSHRRAGLSVLVDAGRHALKAKGAWPGDHAPTAAGRQVLEFMSCLQLPCPQLCTSSAGPALLRPLQWVSSQVNDSLLSRQLSTRLKVTSK